MTNLLDRDPALSVARTLLLLSVGAVLLALGLAAEPYARLDPGIAAALDYAKAPVGSPPANFDLNFARGSWVRPLNLVALPGAFFALWLTFGPTLLGGWRSPRASDEAANAILLAALPGGLLLMVLANLPAQLERPLEDFYAAWVPLQVVPASIALTGAAGFVAFLASLNFRLKRPLAPRNGSEEPDEAMTGLPELLRCD